MPVIWTWNSTLFLWVNHLSSALPDWWWSSLTLCGHAAVAFAFSAPALLRCPRLISALLIGAPLGGGLSHILKGFFQIPRPPAVLPLDQFHLIGHKLELVSFPSGHTLTAFALSTLLIAGLRLRGWRLGLVVLFAALVGWSRMAVGVHWPLDVLGGAVLGVLCGVISWRLSQVLHQQTWTHHIGYQLFQCLVVGGISSSLFFIQLGYPAAHGWQWCIAAFGVIFSLFALLSRLKSLISS